MKNYQQLEELEPTPRIYPISGLPINIVQEEVRKFYSKKAKEELKTIKK